MLSTLVAVVAVAAAPVPATSEPAATGWIALVDQQRWDDSWGAAGTLFKSQIGQAQWVSAVRGVRAPLGPVVSRSLEGVTKACSLPGAPDGEYEVLQFRTSFANKKDAVETIVLAHEPSGWRVNGYFVS